MTNNGTPYSDETWKKWYARKSSSELWQEEQERLQEEQERLNDIQENTDSLEEKLEQI